MTLRSTGRPPSEHVAIDALSLLSRKWQPIVLLVLAESGAMRFNELLDALPNVSGKVLSGTLEELGEADLVERTVVSESPLRVEYGLTEAGRDMEPVFEALTAWGEQHLESDAATVLLADGDPRITEMFEQWLDDSYTVVRAHDAEELRDRVRDGPDVLLFERTLPGAEPEEVIDAVGPDCRTVMLLGDRPGFGLLETDCDDVLRKPIVRDTAIAAVEEQIARREESPERREYAALVAKRSLLETVHSPEALQGSVQYLDASRRIEALEEELEGAVGQLQD